MNNSIFFVGENPRHPHHLTIRKLSPANRRRRFFINRFLPILSVVALVLVLLAPALMPPKGQAAAALTGAGVASRRAGVTPMQAGTSPFGPPVPSPFGVTEIIVCETETRLVDNVTNTPIAFRLGHFDVLNPNIDCTFTIAGSGSMTGTEVRAASGTATDGTPYVAVVTQQAGTNFMSVIFAKDGTFTVTSPIQVATFTTICTAGLVNSNTKDSLLVTDLNRSVTDIYQIPGVTTGQPQKIKTIDFSPINPTNLLVTNFLLGPFDDSFVATTQSGVVTARITNGNPGYSVTATLPLPGMNTIVPLGSNGRSGVVVFNRFTGPTATVLNNNNGALQQGALLQFPYVSNYLVTDDFSGSGNVDIVGANSGSTNATLFTNNGNGGFNPAVSVLLDVSPNSLGTLKTPGAGPGLIAGTLNGVVCVRNTTKPTIEVTKTVSPAGDAHPGDRLTYKIHIVNNGSVSLSGELSDELPDGSSEIDGSEVGGIFFDGVFEASDIVLKPSKSEDVSFTVLVNVVATGKVITNRAQFDYFVSGKELVVSSNTVQTPITPTPVPTITGACKGDGKQLIINGTGFVDGAKVFLNGGAEKTTFVSSTQVIAVKAGKRALTGDTVEVHNPGGTVTAGFTYTRTNCSP